MNYDGIELSWQTSYLGMMTILFVLICLLQSTLCDISPEQQEMRIDPGKSHSVIDGEETEPVDNTNTEHISQITATTGRNQIEESEISNQNIPLTESDKTESSQVDVVSTEEIVDQIDNVLEESGKDNPKVFSLTNFIKSWLNPVLQEFQEGLNVGKEKNDTDVSNNNNANIKTADLTNNTQAQDTKNVTDTAKHVKFNCTGRNVTENTTATVRLVNSTVLLEFLNFDKSNNTIDCVLIMFYAPWCKFCADTAAQFNAVGRAFIQLDVLAVDAVHFSNLNARFGTVAVPNIMVFHNSRSAIRFNHTERTFVKLVEFVTNVTGLEPNTSIQVEENDYIGPLSSEPTMEIDYLLWCAWLFVLTCFSYIFVNSQYGQGAIEKVRTLWQEHQHIE